LGDLERLEDEFLGIVRESAAVANSRIKAQWDGVFEHLPAGGTSAGAEADALAAKMAAALHTTVRKQREGAARVGHMLVQNYGTLASGILIGLSEGLRRNAPSPAATTTRSRKIARH
jgi:hypothetical protein